MNDYKRALLDNASKLDAVTSSYGEIVKLANSIAEVKDEGATKTLLHMLLELVRNDSNDIKVKQLVQAVHDSLIDFYGYEDLKNIYNSEAAPEDKRTLSELLRDLNTLIGLKNVKCKVNDLIAYQQVQQMRRKQALYSGKNTMHMAFMGNPGTGKTTVARIVGRIYKKLGLLSKGQFIEASRTDLIAGYQGQTALKVKKVIEKAKGGVLFIDEAYSITENDHSDSYGRECLTELTKALEDYRDDLVVIVAGYTDPMKKFFESNPGLKSRFNTFIEFDDYDEQELNDILKMMCKKNDYILSQDAEDKFKNILSSYIAHKDNEFANGRLARNLYEDTVMNHARRVNKIQNPNRSELMELKLEDVPDGASLSCFRT